jgi:soluble lytic murein transglycosylase-like protein
MPKRIFMATASFARRKVGHSAMWTAFARDAAGSLATTAQHAIMALGVIAIAAWGVLFFKPEVADSLKALSPFASNAADQELAAAASTTVSVTTDTGSKADTASTTATSAPVQAPVTPPAARVPEAPVSQQGPASIPAAATVVTALHDHKQDKSAAGASTAQQKWVTEWLSKRYRVAADATNVLVSTAYVTAKEIKLDPLLILSVIAIESGFNPFAESPVGAQGLMQVMSKVHRDKFEHHGGLKAALNPMANIRVGSLILKDYVTRGGSVEAGLKMYVGAGAFDSDAGYGSKVMAEYKRLKDVAMGKKVPVITPPTPAAPAKAAPKERETEPSFTNSASAEDSKKKGQEEEKMAAL